MSIEKVLPGLALILAIAIKISAQEMPFNHGMRHPAEYDNLAEGFADPSMIYAPFMFWFWDAPMDTEHVSEMAEAMINQGINPGYIHPRRSMNESPGLPPEQWLGKEWFDGFKAVTKLSSENSAYLGYIDEYWWPSLQAKGRVLDQHPGLKALTLETNILYASTDEKIRVPAATFTLAGKILESGKLLGSSLRVIGEGEAFNWKAPEGKWKLFQFSKTSRNTVNYMDNRLGDAFIAIALEPYETNMGDELGQTIIADFVDTEGSYGERLVWSDTLASRYEKRFGRDIRLDLPLMLDYDDQGLWARVRWQWFDLVSDIYMENFGKVVDWHTERGMYCIPNFWEESLPAQTLRVADHLKMQRKYTMPGQDALHSGVLLPHDFMEAVSVGEFENRRVMSEMMGASQWHRFNPVMLKKAINSVTAWGISNTSPHAVYTNRNLRGNHWMPDWYTENPLFSYLHLWSDFARRASYINSFGRKEAKVLLYSPLESVWVLTDSAHFDSRKEAIRHPWSFPSTTANFNLANRIDRAYAKAMNDLTKARIDYLICDRHYIKEMALSGGTWNHKNFHFTTLVLPPMIILETPVAQKILDFARNGGQVYALGELPTASVERGAKDPEMERLMIDLATEESFHSCQGEPMITFATFHNHWMGWEYQMNTDAYGLMPHIRLGSPGLNAPVQFAGGEFDMLSQHRVIDGAHFFWLVNNQEEEKHCTLLFPGLEGKVSIWDCEKGTSRQMDCRQSEKGLLADLSFKALDAFWLVIDPQERLEMEALEIPGKSELEIPVKGPWRIRYLEDGQPELEPIWTIPDNMVQQDGIQTGLKDWALIPGLHKRFTGFLDYYTSIDWEARGGSIIIDLGEVNHMAELWVNGRQAGKRLWPPYEFEIEDFLLEGKNEFRIRVGNQADNYYANPESSGLMGPVIIHVAQPDNER